MPRLSPALELGVPVREVREIAGVTVPWEVKSYRDDAAVLAAGPAVFDLGHWEAVRVHGPDAFDFLHRLTTWNAKARDKSRADRGAVLNGRAHALAMGWFLPGDDEVLLVFPGPQGTRAASHLEAMHFAENLTIASAPYAVFATAGTPSGTPGALAQSDGRWHWTDDVQPLHWTLVPVETATAWLSASKLPVVGYRVFDWLRLLAAIPEVGRELAENAIVLEGNFEKPIARNKGCYPGQEVIERIFTYGQVNRRLYPIAWDAVRDPSSGARLSAAVSAAPALPEALVVATERNPDGQGGIGLAAFPRAAWDYAGPWTATLSDGETISVRRR